MKDWPFRLLLGLAVLLPCACSSPTPVNAPVAGQSARSPKIPWAEIETLYNPRARQTLQGMTPAGYVIMEGIIDDAGKVRVRKIRESFPDHSRDQAAQAFGQKAEIHAPTIGSLLEARADIYVIFYEHVLEDHIAVVFAKRLDFAGNGPSTPGVYLNAFAY